MPESQDAMFAIPAILLHPLVWLWHSGREQAQLVRELWMDHRFRVPVWVVWVSAFGGALHAPVTTYFYLEIGATDLDIGVIGFTINFGTIFLSPIYGRLLDTFGSYYVILMGCFVCGVGCLIRGIAIAVWMLYCAGVLFGIGAGVLFTAVLSHVSANLPQEKRGLVVSGLLMQDALLRLLGKACYPMWISLLSLSGIAGQNVLVRDRITMSVCTFFCLYGVFAIWSRQSDIATKRHEHAHASQVVSSSPSSLHAHHASPRHAQHCGGGGSGGAGVEECSPVLTPRMEEVVRISHPMARRTSSPDAIDLHHHVHLGQEDDGGAVDGGGADDDGRTEQHGKDGCGSGVGLVECIVAFASAMQAMADAACRVLWPLFVMEHYHWNAEQFALPLLVASIVSTASVGLFPAMEKRFGRLRTAQILCIGAGVSSSLMYSHALQMEGAWPAVAHVAIACVFFGCTAMLEPSIKTVGSLMKSRGSEGSSFGWLATTQAVGRVMGSLVGAYMFHYTKSVGEAGEDGYGGLRWLSRAAPWLQGGSLPGIFVGALLVASATSFIHLESLGGSPSEPLCPTTTSTTTTSRV